MHNASHSFFISHFASRFGCCCFWQLCFFFLLHCCLLLRIRCEIYTVIIINSCDLSRGQMHVKCTKAGASECTHTNAHKFTYTYIYTLTHATLFLLECCFATVALCLLSPVLPTYSHTHTYIGMYRPLWLSNKNRN